MGQNNKQKRSEWAVARSDLAWKEVSLMRSE